MHCAPYRAIISRHRSVISVIASSHRQFGPLMLLYCATCSCSTSRVKRDETGNQARRGDQYSLPLTPDCLVVKTSRITVWAHSVPGTCCCEPIKNDLRHM